MVKSRVVMSSIAWNHELAPDIEAMLGTDSSIIALTLTPIVINNATSKALPAGEFASNMMVYRESLNPFLLIIGPNYVILVGLLPIDMTTQPIDISRIDTASLVFPSGDVLSDDRARTKRSKRIHSATYVGNIRQEKVAIVFQTEKANFKVQTTIWLNYGGCIYLKGNITIPVERVLSVDWL